MRIVLMGPPGAGKGTQAKRLAQKFGMSHLSSGDIFRIEKASGSELGATLGEYMNAGRLVPDGVVVDVMVKAVASARGGLLLDGFPRTVPQAEALDRQLDEAGMALDAVLVITAETSEIIARITGRRTCTECGHAHHLEFMPPGTPGICDACGAKLVQRDDDTEPVVNRRLEEYYRQTEPVLAYYRARDGLSVIEIDGNRKPDEVTTDAVAALNGLRDRDIRRTHCGGQA